MRLRRLAGLFLLVLVPLGFDPGCRRHSAACSVCGREVHREVRAALVLASGRERLTCCPRCALHEKERSKDPVRSIRVTDFNSGAGLDLTTAWLVEGSDETPCLRHHPPAVGAEGTPMHACYDRCMPSLVAFRDDAAARTFVAQHGGSVLPPPAAAPGGARPPGSLQ